MAARSPTGEWCSPTHVIGGSQLIRLVEKSRDSAAAVEMIHDEPTRKCPSGALEALARGGLATPKPAPVTTAQPSRRPQPKFAASDCEIDSVMALLDEMLEPAPLPPPPVVRSAEIELPAVQLAPSQPRKVRNRIGTRIALWIAVLGGIGAGMFVFSIVT